MTIRRIQRYSDDPVQLASQVGELAEDVDAALGLSITAHTWEGVVSFGKRFRVNVGETKPTAVLCVAVEDIVGRTFLNPGPIIWSWVDGQAQIDESSIGFAADTRYRCTFLAVRV